MARVNPVRWHYIIKQMQAGVANAAPVAIIHKDPVHTSAAAAWSECIGLNELVPRTLSGGTNGVGGGGVEVDAGWETTTGAVVPVAAICVSIGLFAVPAGSESPDTGSVVGRFVGQSGTVGSVPGGGVVDVGAGGKSASGEIASPAIGIV